MARALGNQRPPLLQLVEKEIFRTLFRLATEELDIVAEMNRCLACLPWDRLQVLKDDLELAWFQPEAERELRIEDINTAAQPLANSDPPPETSDHGRGSRDNLDRMDTGGDGEAPAQSRRDGVTDLITSGGGEESQQSLSEGAEKLITGGVRDRDGDVRMETNVFGGRVGREESRNPPSGSNTAPPLMDTDGAEEGNAPSGSHSAAPKHSRNLRPRVPEGTSIKSRPKGPSLKSLGKRKDGPETQSQMSQGKKHKGGKKKHRQSPRPETIRSGEPIDVVKLFVSDISFPFQCCCFSN